MPAKRSSAARQRKKLRKKTPRPPMLSARKTRAKGGATVGKGESKILAHLGPEDARIALCIFAERHPELVPELEDIVREVGAGVAFEDLANNVVAAIEELTMFDLARNHAADQFHYKGETETAVDVFEETLTPFVEALSRLARMGLVDAALQQCQGVLLGLYRAEHEQVSELLDWIPDGVSELAYGPLEALGPIRRRRAGSGSLTVGKALKQFALEHLPDWDWLQD